MLSTLEVSFTFCDSGEGPDEAPTTRWDMLAIAAFTMWTKGGLMPQA